MDLLLRFTDFVTKEMLYAPDMPWLLALSGGMDSVTLCELAHRAGIPFELAHANFQLRGEESTRDELFCRELAARYGKTIHIRQFDTMSYAREWKASTQVAARNLRYEWFRELLVGEKHGPRFIATAHHQDDNAETILMNFFKGSGIAGLRGILPKQGDVVHPLLFATREELRDFAVREGLTWVEDSSNASDKYTRNFFRHKIIPLIQESFPETMSNLAANARRFRDIELIYRKSIDTAKSRLIEYRGEEIFIPARKLQKTQPLETVVYEIIKDFGFSSHQSGAVIALLESGSGKYVSSATHRILRDRAWLIISPLKTPQSAHILIESTDQPLSYENGGLHFRSLSAMPQHPSPDTALLDHTLIHFPLLLRKWRAGDYFYPLGMHKKKKLARFLIDNKRSLAQKEKTWVLEMDKKIIWVVGMRIDDRFKATAQSDSILEIRTTGA